MENEIQKQNNALSTELFTENQLRVYDSVFKLIDRNPKLKWDKDNPNHNQDFCLIDGNIEPTRNFALKVTNLARYGTAITNTDISHSDGTTYVVITARVWDAEDKEMYTEASGACDTRETSNKRSKRLFHDAVGIAETRALKRAIELKFGVAIFNQIIYELFGGFNIETGEKEREVSMPPENRKIITDVNKKLKAMGKAGKMTKAEYDEWVDRLKQNQASVEGLRSIQKTVNELEAVRNES